ncbi:MAG: hypothetical protein WCD37_19060 [Chloroflexia bacterium]
MLPPDRRRSLFDYKIVAAYLLGTLTGALLTGMGAWVLSGFAQPLSTEVRLVLLVIVAVFFWLSKHGPLSGIISLPESRRLIPAEVFGGSMIRGAYRFGLELGTGLRTYVPSVAPYILVLVVLLTQLTLANALLVAIGFGFGRAIPLMMQLVAANQMRSANLFLRGADYLVSTVAGIFILAGAVTFV